MSSNVISKFPILGELGQTVQASIRKIYVFINHGENAFFITKNDDVFGVGSNHNVCLGIGKDGECNKARKITPLCKKEILNISYGDRHLLALSADGSVYSWGCNDYGQLGNGTTNRGPSPAPVTNIQHKKTVQVACGGGHSLALSDDGEIYAWGCNNLGQIGSGSRTDQFVPLKVTSQIGTRRAISIACGAGHSVALLDNGEVYTWGDNGAGQLGLGNNDEQSIPCKVEALSGKVITQIVCGYHHTLVLTQQGSIYSWGWNYYGQLGTGDKTNYNHPKQILIDERFTEIAAGQCYGGTMHISAGLTDTGRVYMWGDDKHTSPYLTEYTIIDELYANIPDEPFTWRLCSVEGGALMPNHMRTASRSLRVQLDETKKERDDLKKENETLRRKELIRTDPAQLSEGDALKPNRMRTVSSCGTQTDIDRISIKEFEKVLDEIEIEKDISMKEMENLRKENETLSRKHEVLFNENKDLRQELSEGDALKPNRMRTVSSCETQTDIDCINVKEFEKLRVKLDETEKEMENLRKENEMSSRKHEVLFNENKDLRQELSGYMNLIHQKALQKCWFQLVKDIGNPADICDVLISKEIFSHDTLDEIMAERTNTAKCRHLLNVVRVGGQSAFDAFLTALRVCHRTHLADQLDHTVSGASGGNR